METIPSVTAAPAPAPQESAPACPACAAANAEAAPRKLDLTGMAAPGDLRAARLEEFTIDGICGVY